MPRGNPDRFEGQEATGTLFQRAAPETCLRIGPQAKAQFQTSLGVYLN